MSVGRAVLSRLALVLVVALPGCTEGDTLPGPDTVAPGPSGGEAGAEITVTGPVGRIVDPHVFEIGTHDGEPVLVVVPPGAGGVASGAEAEVTGTVETFDLPGIERSIGVRLDPGLVRFNGRSCVIARTVKERGGTG